MNLSIPDAAAELAVSETRLRRTLQETAVPTLVEFRQTRTGVRKTTVLSPDAIARLRAFFAVPPASLQGEAQCVEAPADPEEDANATWPRLRASADLHADRGYGRGAGSPGGTSGSTHMAEPVHGIEYGTDGTTPHGYSIEPEQTVNIPADAAPSTIYSPAAAGQSVPVAQFNALLYQHNVLRQELTRVTEYLDGCDRLLGEMVRTIATLEERTRQLDSGTAPSRRAANPLSGALRTVSAGVQNAFFSRSASKPLMKPAEVFYSNVLAGR